MFITPFGLRIILQSNYTDYKTRGKNVDAEYAKLLAERKKTGNKRVAPSSVVPKPEPKPPVVIPPEIVGKKIKHKAFGIGTIKAISGASIDVDFERVGIKKMGYEFCMEKNMLEFI